MVNLDEYKGNSWFIVNLLQNYNSYNNGKPLRFTPHTTTRGVGLLSDVECRVSNFFSQLIAIVDDVQIVIS